MSQAPDRIDCHHHIVPEIYREALDKVGIGRSGGKNIYPWTVQDSLDYMEKYEVRTGICSISEPVAYPLIEKDFDWGRQVCRQVNELMADMHEKYPTRFGGYALLPMPDVEASIEEAVYALDVLKLDGVGFVSNYGSDFLGNRKFDPLFDELQKRKACVYVHPGVPPKDYVRPEFVTVDFMEEFVFNTARAAMNLVLSGTMERCPDLKICLSHMGGVFPYLKYRMIKSFECTYTQRKVPVADYVWDRWDTLSKPMVEYMAQFWYDCALATEPVQWLGVLDIAPDHIVWGTDSFFGSPPTIKYSIENFERYVNAPSAKYAINRGNAEKMFPRYKM